MKKQVTLSLELAKTMFKTGGVARQFALENFTKEELTKKELPKSWEELGEVQGYYITGDSSIKLSTGSSTTFNENKNIYPTKELVEASLALCQLLQLRDRYNGDWKPDWITSLSKFSILMCSEDIVVRTMYNTSIPLSFKTSELRDEFLNNFRGLIEIAKPLL